MDTTTKTGKLPGQMPRWAWRAFVFFSVLAALSAFKFVPAGLIYGLLPNLKNGFVDASYQFVVEGIRRGTDNMVDHIENVGVILAVHMMAGGSAVLLVPLQVSRSWRRGDRRKHVYLGWALVPIVTVAALTTPPVAFNMTQPFWSELGFALGALAWFGALVIGICSIKAKQFDRHRRWMVMMAALSFGAVSFRLQYPIMRLFLDKELVFPYLGWTCWVPNVLVVLWWWQRDTRQSVRTPN